jgi:hypothetical protein
MVVPVPVVLKKSDIKVVNQQIFTMLNDYSKPRLVEYYDQNPCNTVLYERDANKNLSASVPGVNIRGYSSLKKETVKIEAKYSRRI